jgi:hypothetical protein
LNSDVEENIFSLCQLREEKTKYRGGLTLIKELKKSWGWRVGNWRQEDRPRKMYGEVGGEVWGCDGNK